MRNYQPKKNNEYKLDKVLFRRMIFLVKDYERMQTTINDIADVSSVQGSIAHSNLHSDITLYKVIKIERMREECRAVKWALEQIPIEYQQVIFNKVCHDSAYPLYADASTFSRWKCRFLYNIAKKLMYI